MGCRWPLLTLPMVALGIIGCASDAYDMTCPALLEPGGDAYQYVLDQVLLPTSDAEIAELGLDVDADGAGRVDNGFGSFLVALSMELDGLDLRASADRHIATGRSIELVQVQASSLTTAAGVAVWLFPGANPSVPPCATPDDAVCGQHLDGLTSFDAAIDDASDYVLIGQVVGSVLHAGPGNIAIEIPIFAELDPLVVHPVGARADLSTAVETRLTGTLGGAISANDLRDSVLPDLAAMLTELLRQECGATPTAENPCGCTTGRASRAVTLFDLTAPRCAISAAELQTSSLGQLLEPDVDLFDQTGQFEPRRDGVPDSLSVGLGVSAVGASFGDVSLPRPCF